MGCVFAYQSDEFLDVRVDIGFEGRVFFAGILGVVSRKRIFDGTRREGKGLKTSESLLLQPSSSVWHRGYQYRSP
jgi:hypothetical protein